MKNFDITLPWKTFGTTKDYIVSFFTQQDAAAPALQKLITGTSYSMNKNKVFAGRVYYEVSAQLPNGFTVHSRASSSCSSLIHQLRSSRRTRRSFP